MDRASSPAAQFDRGGRARLASVSPETAALRRSRSHPRPTQFDYLLMRYLLGSVTEALRRYGADANEILDVYCGPRPYDELLPRKATVVGLDVFDVYGLADVVSDEFLPFPDESFDLVMSTEAFYYLSDADHAVAEIRRVLRPGRAVVITVPHVWEYNRETYERRYTGQELLRLFEGWDDVELVENGGRAVVWATLTGRLVNLIDERLPATAKRFLRPLFAMAYAAINAVGAGIDAAERQTKRHAYTLPMNLMITARRPREPTDEAPPTPTSS
jgi:SAM-dependent methyltransferase